MNGTGQRGKHQLNLLTDVEAVLGNEKHGYWCVKNGYCMPSEEGDSMAKVTGRLDSEEGLEERVRSKLRVGVQWSTEVSSRSSSSSHQVCQVYASAVPVTYTVRMANRILAALITP